MTEEEQKEAVDAMRKAQANMRAVLDRVGVLERALNSSVSLAERLIKDFVPGGVYVKDQRDYHHPARDHYTDRLNEIRKTIS